MYEITMVQAFLLEMHLVAIGCFVCIDVQMCGCFRSSVHWRNHKGLPVTCIICRYFANEFYVDFITIRKRYFLHLWLRRCIAVLLRVLGDIRMAMILQFIIVVFVSFTVVIGMGTAERKVTNGDCDLILACSEKWSGLCSVCSVTGVQWILS